MNILVGSKGKAKDANHVTVDAFESGGEIVVNFSAGGQTRAVRLLIDAEGKRITAIGEDLFSRQTGHDTVDIRA